MKIKEKILGIIAGLFLIFVFGAIGEIDVSNGTTITNKKITENEYIWEDGMGTTIKIKYIEKTDNEKFKELKEYTLFDITVEQDEGPTFLMVDLDYDKMKLKDDMGTYYPLLNDELSKIQSQEISSLLETFKWTMFNQAFPGGESLAVNKLRWNGVLVFPRINEDAKKLNLQLTYNMSGQKVRFIECDFDSNK